MRISCRLLSPIAVTMLFASFVSLVSAAEVDTSPLPIKTEIAFPNLKWTGWSPLNEQGIQTPLRPVTIGNAGDGSNRLFMLTQQGTLHSFKNSSEPQESKVVLDLTSRIHFSDKEFEEGFLGLAFHPKFRENGYFFIYYTTTEAPDISIISRFQMSKENPDVVDPKSEVEILRIPQPYWNHNGGTVAFGPDGYLYIGLGDGGAGSDPHKNGQNLNVLLGKILRIDIDHQDGDQKYAIPADNPFVGKADAKPEIWAYGVRNIWRLSFDRKTGALWAADVGQDLWEEINIITKGGNYGWNIREGFHPFDPKMPKVKPEESPTPTGLIDPIFEYDHSVGKSITGGNVYRGKLLPELSGAYLYGDFVSGKMWALYYDAAAKKVTANRPIHHANKIPMLTFGEDEAGEIYFGVAAPDGRGIYKFVKE
ncbi:MAG: PQQ-dependent sugar dehydrogenase [Planctomycetales bacterium]